MRRLAALLLAGLALALAACGEEETETPAAPPAAGAGQLRVEVTEAGEPQTFTCGEGCDPAAIAKVLEDAADPARACTEQYGGPETAKVSGMLEGQPVEATITRSDGCGIADYDALFAALGVEPPLAR